MYMVFVDVVWTLFDEFVCFLQTDLDPWESTKMKTWIMSMPKAVGSSQKRSSDRLKTKVRVNLRVIVCSCLLGNCVYLRSVCPESFPVYTGKRSHCMP
jgi:hypothetical protein